MTKALFIEAMTKVLAGVLLLGLLLFGPAGTLDYPEGWRLMGILFIPMFLAGIVMMIKCPALLKKRLSAKEKLGEQKVVILLSAIMFIAAFALAGVSFRYDLLMLPQWVSFAGCAAFLLAYALYALVLRENEFLSRTIEVQEGQHVVDTGLYGIVRHPMYSATILLFISMPLILRSLLSLLVLLTYPAIIIMRLRSEEAFLAQNLEGYSEYMKKVRWRLIPFIW